MGERVRCLLCGHSFPVGGMEQMKLTNDWICKDRQECLDRQKEKG